MGGARAAGNADGLLLARTAVLSHRRFFVNRTFPFVWSGFAVLTVAAMLALWATQCLLDASLLDIRKTVIRGLLMIVRSSPDTSGSPLALRSIPGIARISS